MVFFSPSGTPLQNPYTILNINPPPQSCTDEEITKSFKKLMLQLHPDKQPINQSSENALFVSIKLHDVMDAKSFLLDGEYLAARREYDAKLIRDSQPPPPPPQPSPVVSSSTTVPGSNNNTSSNTVPPQQQGTSTRNTSTATTDKKTATQTSSSSAAVNNNSKNGKKKKIDEQIDKGSNNNKSTTKSKPTSNTSNNKQQAAPIPKKGTVKQWGKQYQKRDKTTTPRNTTDKTLSRGATPSVSSSTMNNNKTSSNRDTTTMKRRASLDNGKEDTINKDVATSNKPKRETQHKNKSESKNLNLNSKSKSCSRDAKKTTAHNNRTPSSMDSKAQRIPPKTTRSRTTNSSSAAFDDSCGDFSTTTADSMTSDDDRRHTYSSSNNYCSLGNNKPSSNRPPRVQRNRIPRPAGEVSSSGSSRPHYRSASTSKVQGVGNNSSGKGAEKSVRHKSAPDAATTSSSQHAQAPQPPPTATHTPINNFSAFKPAITILEQQYHCPLTKSLMITPVSDMEGNSYEKSAILKHLETSNKSPITGNILMPSDLREDTALLEKIRYTVKLKSRLNALQTNAIPAHQPQASDKPQCNQQQHQQQSPIQPSRGSSGTEYKFSTLQEAVNTFIIELNSGSTQPSVSINQLDNWGITSFTYLGLKFRLEVPTTGLAENILMIQTWYEQSKKVANISARVVQFNAALQKIGLGGKLTFRNMNGKYAFTFTKSMDPLSFSKVELRHGIEYFMEMSIKIHNIIHTMDVRKVPGAGKVRLMGGVAV